MTLETVGALCFGLVIGWAVASPRDRRVALIGLTLALAMVPPVLLTVDSLDSASGAVVAALVGFGSRLLLDLGLIDLANTSGRR